MTALRATAIDELCQTLGLRTPIGVVAGLHREVNDEPKTEPARLTDEELTALGVLSQPEAIAVVTLWSAPQSFRPTVPVVHVLATRGPWLAEHVIEGDAHHLHAADADNAALLLLDRCGFVEPSVTNTTATINVTLHTYRRMTELVKAGDARRARAALVAEGAIAHDAEELVAAASVGRVEVAGLGADGHRFVGCDLAIAGDETTGRWLIPSTQHVDAVPKHAYRHPSFGALAGFGAPSGNLRVLIESIATDALQDELALIFGDV